MRQQRKLTFLVALIVVVACGLAAGAAASAAQGNDEAERITLEDFRALMSNGTSVLVLDVRSGEPEQKIKGARHIPLENLEARLKELPRNREIVTYCA